MFSSGFEARFVAHPAPVETDATAATAIEETDVMGADPFDYGPVLQ